MNEDQLELISIYNYPVLVAGTEYLVLIHNDEDESSEHYVGYMSINEFERDYTSNSNQ